MPLSNGELWQRVRRLEGTTVYTCTTRNPNRIVRVTDNRVEIAERASRIYRREVVKMAKLLAQEI